MTTIILSILGIVVANVRLNIDTIINRRCSERFKAFAGSMMVNIRRSLQSSPFLRCLRCAENLSDASELADFT
ncbi:MAG: hypothetical protein K2Y17_09370 [Qipengyuania sp.]|nr:hypothetical protein [Qipengyuania sp.]